MSRSSSLPPLRAASCLKTAVVLLVPSTSKPTPNLQVCKNPPNLQVADSVSPGACGSAVQVVQPVVQYVDKAGSPKRVG